MHIYLYNCRTNQNIIYRQVTSRTYQYPGIFRKTRLGDVLHKGNLGGTYGRNLNYDFRIHACNRLLNRNREEDYCRGGSGGGGAHPARGSPLKLKKIWFFCVKSWIFTRNTSTIRFLLTWNPGSAPIYWFIYLNTNKVYCISKE